ncbi:MAG: ABC transporter ATP-binding protein [Candidatus Dormibacteraeota bacterium]|nr:ABC transporter ATP-binding protein [Candidatus Dormibacteraeota bacterium]
MGASSDFVLELVHLTKVYADRTAVSDLSLKLAGGEILGFVGPNGAGKTTTIRMALNLVRPTQGTVRVLGEDIWQGGSAVLSRVGALVEAPALYPHLSGRENLSAFGKALGIGSDVVDSLLDVVDLGDRQNERVRTYSLGMKQRLGLAVALLGDPDLLILDEPANGLDPIGIADMRDLLRRLAEEGRAIFLSSHVLHEVEILCDRVAIIDGGKLVREGPVGALVGRRSEFLVRVDEPRAALDVLRAQPWGASARMQGGRLVTPSPTGRGRDLWTFLDGAGHTPETLDYARRALEDVFLDVTSPTAEAAGGAG